MNFFEPLPPEDAPKRHQQPPWSAPSDAELGVAVPMRMVLATGDGAFIALTDFVAFSTGFEMGIRVRSREQLQQGMLFGRPLEPGKPIPDDLLRIGVQFSDGQKGTSLGFTGRGFREWMKAREEGREPELPKGIVMAPRGGGGGGRRWDHRYWVWPLPPQGEIQIACEWPARGIPLTMHSMDAAPILEASRQSTKLWDDPDDPSGGGWSSTSFIRR